MPTDPIYRRKSVQHVRAVSNKWRLTVNNQVKQAWRFAMRNPTPYELYLAPGVLAREAYDWMFKIYRAMDPYRCGYSPSRQLLSQLRRVPKTPYLCKALPADVHLMMLDFISVVSRLEDNLRDESLWLNDHTVAKEGRTAWDEAYEQIGEIMHRKPRWL